MLNFAPVAARSAKCRPPKGRSEPPALWCEEPALNRSLRDLGEIFEALRERHAFVYYGILIMTALGVLGIVCIIDSVLPKPSPITFPSLVPTYHMSFLCAVICSRSISIQSHGEISRAATVARKGKRCEPEQGIRAMNAKQSSTALILTTDDAKFLADCGILADEPVQKFLYPPIELDGDEASASSDAAI